MRPRGENVEYDKLRDRYDALAAELAELKATHQRIAIAQCQAEARYITRIAALEAELAESKAEEDNSYELVRRQGDLLRGVVNALRGAPPEDTLWSHHDAPELAAAAVAALREIFEVYAGSDGFAAVTAQAMYLQGLVKQMADIAAKGMKP